MFVATAVACAAVVGASLIGGALPMARALGHTRLQLYLSFSAGAMLGAAFFHMLPEAVRLGSPGAIRWALAGLLVLFLAERFFAYHRHEVPAGPEISHGHGHGHGPAAAASLHWGAATLGLALHSLIGGVALAGAVAQDRGLGPGAWAVLIATLVHKPADALTIVSLMLRAGATRGRAHLINLGFGLMIPLGAGLFWIGRGRLGDAGGMATSDTLAFSAGTFLCIALADLLPEIQFHRHDRWKLSAALLAGVGLMALAGQIEGL